MKREIKIDLNITKHRQARHISQAKLAKLIGVSEQIYRMMESGEYDITFRQLAEIADYIDTPFLNLFSVNHMPPIDPYKPLHNYAIDNF